MAKLETQYSRIPPYNYQVRARLQRVREVIGTASYATKPGLAQLRNGTGVYPCLPARSLGAPTRTIDAADGRTIGRRVPGYINIGRLTVS